MSKNNQFSKTPNVVVSASLGIELYNQLRNLQKQGNTEAFWSNCMRRGARLIIDCAQGNDPYEKIQRLVLALEQQSQSQQMSKVSQVKVTPVTE